MDCRRRWPSLGVSFAAAGLRRRDDGSPPCSRSGISGWRGGALYPGLLTRRLGEHSAEKNSNGGSFTSACIFMGAVDSDALELPFVGTANVFVYYPYLRKARSAPPHYVHGSAAHPVDGIFIVQLSCPRTSMLLPLKA
jgi:hypothetical protein